MKKVRDVVTTRTQQTSCGKWQAGSSADFWEASILRLGEGPLLQVSKLKPNTYISSSSIINVTTGPKRLLHFDPNAGDDEDPPEYSASALEDKTLEEDYLYDPNTDEDGHIFDAETMDQLKYENNFFLLHNYFSL